MVCSFIRHKASPYMEQFRRHDKIGKVSFSRHSSLPCVDERMEAVSQNKAPELFKEQSKMLTCYCPLEVPKSPNDAMEFLSRTWSPSSSDFYRILSSMDLKFSLSGRNPDHASEELSEPETEKNKNNFTRDAGRTMDQVLTMIPGRKLVQSTTQKKHRDLRSGWMDVGHMKAWLGGDLLSSLSGGCRRKKKEELRLHTAQVHAALSVARLAAAIAGIVGNSYMDPISSKVMNMDTLGGEFDTKMSTVVSSAAALVATVCAEAAESVGAKRAQVASVVRAGLAARTSADLLTLTASAATCLRGAATLELRAASYMHHLEDQDILARGAQLPVQIPQGKVQLRMVRIYLKNDKATLRLGKRHMGGVISTHKEYRIFDEADTDSKECGFLKSRHGCCYLITLGTSGGMIQLLFEDQKRYILWKSSISNLLCDC